MPHPKVPVLPSPDEKHNYWLETPFKAPAIICSPRLPNKPESLRDNLKWFITLNDARAAVFEKDNLVYFDKPEDALLYYNEKVAV